MGRTKINKPKRLDRKSLDSIIKQHAKDKEDAIEKEKLQQLKKHEEFKKKVKGCFTKKAVESFIELFEKKIIERVKKYPTQKIFNFELFYTLTKNSSLLTLGTDVHFSDLFRDFEKTCRYFSTSKLFRCDPDTLYHFLSELEHTWNSEHSDFKLITINDGNNLCIIARIS